MLEDITIGVILAAKNGYKDEVGKEAVKKFLVDWTYCPMEEYTDNALFSILIRCFIDYVDNCRSPMWVLNEFFGHKYKFGYDNPIDEMSAILNCFRMAQVRDCVDMHTKEYYYVNGFHDFEFNELKLTINS